MTKLSTAPAGLETPLASLDRVGLDEIGALASPNRLDTKFAITGRQLHAVLASLPRHYAVLDVQGALASRYRTLYFDTDRFDLYARQHGGRRNIYKVRTRCYLDSDRSFLEVKRKTAERRTLKVRAQTPDQLTELDPADAFLAAHYPFAAAALRPVLWNEFTRITLVSKTRPERVTFDADLTFRHGRTAVALPGVVIAELKQERIDRASPFLAAMRQAGARSRGLSKYCLGAAMLHPALRRNRFRPKIRLLRKLSREAARGN